MSATLAPSDWKPGLILTTSPSGGMDNSPDDTGVMLIQRAPDDDGWLAISRGGIVYNIFDSIARLYYPLNLKQGKRHLYVLAALAPREWFGMHPIRLNLKPFGGR